MPSIRMLSAAAILYAFLLGSRVDAASISMLAARQTTSPNITVPNGNFEFVTLAAIGTQNYICKNSKYELQSADASLMCKSNGKKNGFTGAGKGGKEQPNKGYAYGVYMYKNEKANLMRRENAGEEKLVVGKHFFLDQPDANGGRPTWQLTTGSRVTMKKVNNISSPIDPANNIDWVLLTTTSTEPNKASDNNTPVPSCIKGIDLSATTFVVRKTTVGGQPPKMPCTDGKVLRVPYTSDYEFSTKSQSRTFGNDMRGGIVKMGDISRCRCGHRRRGQHAGYTVYLLESSKFDFVSISQRSGGLAMAAASLAAKQTIFGCSHSTTAAPFTILTIPVLKPRDNQTGTPATLAPPEGNTEKLTLIGRGTQNYLCNNNGTFALQNATASLFCPSKDTAPVGRHFFLDEPDANGGV
ncbi:hypothetical protein HK102_002765 [Quaeritorhiza haematococci]|nr:hypothetical protein HK102_002765 [Quaeritorhiza haematococci]